MRKTLTPHEARLWAWVKTLRKNGFHFRRQAPLCGYYPDFICFSRRLVIELDGGGHMENRQAEHDRVRDAVLKREGFRVLRIWNGELDADFDAVSRTVLHLLTSLPRSGEGQARGAGQGGVLTLTGEAPPDSPPPWRAAPACPSPQGGGRKDEHD